MKINQELAKKVLDTVDVGLCHGAGVPIPGKMCVEVAVCYALGLPHGDDPPCVSRALRRLKIRLNDRRWSSDATRAKGLRRLAIAQLGSADTLDEVEFTRRVAEMVIRKILPPAFRAAASVHKTQRHREALNQAAGTCEKEGTREAALSAKKIANAANAANVADAAYYAATAATADATTAAASDTVYAATVVYAASAAKRDEVLSMFAENVVQILIEMKAPGCQWLFLTEV